MSQEFVGRVVAVVLEARKVRTRSGAESLLWAVRLDPGLVQEGGSWDLFVACLGGARGKPKGHGYTSFLAWLPKNRGFPLLSCKPTNKGAPKDQHPNHSFGGSQQITTPPNDAGSSMPGQLVKAAWSWDGQPRPDNLGLSFSMLDL